MKTQFARSTTGRLAALAAVGATSLLFNAVPTVAASAAPAPWTLKIAETSTNGVVGGNIGWGEHQGTFLKALAPVGVTKITIATFQGGPQVQAALQSGAVDVAITGDLPALQARGTPGPTHTRQIGFSMINGDTWLLGRKGGPTTIKGLIGGSIGADNDTVRYRMAYGLLEIKGLLHKVKIDNLGTPEAIAALASGKIDATPVGGAQAVQLKDEGYPVIAKASQYPTLLSTEQTTAYPKFLSQHPGFVKAWGNALSDTNRSIRAHAEAYYEFAAPLDKVTVAQEKAGTNLDNFNTTPFPEAGIKQLESTYNFSVSQKLIKQPFKVTSWLDT